MRNFSEAATYMAPIHHTTRRPIERRRMLLTEPALWIGALSGISVFGELQRPPLFPVNLTYLTFAIVFVTFFLRLLTDRKARQFKHTFSDVWVAMILVFSISGSIMAVAFFGLPLGLLEGDRLSFVGMLLLFFMTRLVATNRRQVYLILSLMLAGLFTQTAIGVASYFIAPNIAFLNAGSDEDGEEGVSTVDSRSFGGAARLSGFMGNPNMFATLPLMALPLSIGLLVGSDSRRKRNMLVIVALLSTFGVLLSFSRSAWIGAALGGMMLIRLLPILPTRLRTRAITFGSVALVVFAIVGGSVFGDAIVSRSESIDDRQSLGSRPEMWLLGMEMMMDYPTGVGLGNYRDVSSVAFATILAGRGAHNSIVNLTTEGGLLTGLGLLGFLWDRLRATARRNRDFRDRAVIIGICGSFIAFTLHTCFHVVHAQIFIWVMAACQVNLRNIDDLAVLESRALSA